MTVGLCWVKAGVGDRCDKEAVGSCEHGGEGGVLAVLIAGKLWLVVLESSLKNSAVWPGRSLYVCDDSVQLLAQVGAVCVKLCKITVFDRHDLDGLGTTAFQWDLVDFV